jgi:hypothetical protein
LKRSLKIRAWCAIGISNRVELKYARADDINLLLTGRYLWTQGWDVFGKAGIARVHQRDDIRSGNATQANPITKYKPILTLGGGYYFTQHFHTYLEYRHIFGSNQNTYNKTYKNGGADFKDVANVDAAYFGVEYFI